MRPRAAKAAASPAGKAPAEGRPRSVNSTADRAIDIMLAFTSEKPVWSAAEIAKHFRMPRSTTYRYINTLRNCGLLAEESSNQYRLGHKILHLARVAKVHDPVLRVAAPLLSELSAAFGETVLLHERVGAEIITLERLESRHAAGPSMTQSQMLPWPATASAKLLLAFAPEAEREDILARAVPIRYTKRTLTSQKSLTAELKTIARQGYGIGMEEFDDGAAGIAAPIFQDNACSYAISMGGAAQKFQGKRLAAMVKGVTAAAARISKALASYG